MYKLNQGRSINAWWSADPRQRFWLEITDRQDVGIDLHCPQRGSHGKRSSGFSLIWWVSPGDVVFHYSLAEDGITSWSRAAGPVTEAPTIWRPHRSATRRRIRQPVAQPGWWLDLDGPFLLAQPLYRPAQVDPAAGARQPFTTDPAIVERGLRGHADTQNELALSCQVGRWIEAKAFEAAPYTPGSSSTLDTGLCEGL
jgi:hypothetical protein